MCDVLWADHCLAKAMPQPNYHFTDMRDVIWHESETATRDALGREEPWQAVSIELDGNIFKRAILVGERRKIQGGETDLAPPLDCQEAKEDIAERVLRYLLSEEKPLKTLDGYVAKDARLIIHRPGETEFVVNLKTALSAYSSAWSLLQGKWTASYEDSKAESMGFVEYCRLDGRCGPIFSVELVGGKTIYSMTIEDEALMTDVGGEFEAREHMSLQLLDTLQQKKSVRLSALIAKSKEERDSLKAETEQVLASQKSAAAKLEGLKEQADAQTLNDID